MEKLIGRIVFVLLLLVTALLLFAPVRVVDAIAEPFVINSFNRNFYSRSASTWDNTKFLGVAVLKNPLDLWVYQEMLYELKPDLVVEAGTWYGGSAYYFSRFMDLLDHGKIVTIDIEEKPNRPQHPRLTYLLGSSTDPEIEAKVKQMIEPGQTVMVVLDSDHSKTHVLNELRLWSRHVSKGSYIVVEDSNVNGHPANPNHGPGPWEAVEAFLKETDSFEVDSSREKYMLTFNPRGYLKRVK